MSDASGKVRVAVTDRRGCRSVEAPGKEFENLLNEVSVSKHGRATVDLSPLSPSRDRRLNSSVMSRFHGLFEVHHLVLDLLYFGSGAGVLLADAITRSTTLNGLTLEYCSIWPDDWEAVCEALKCSSSLKSFRLVDCDVEIDLLAGALEVNGSISNLTIEELKLGDSGASSIAPALQYNSALRELHLTSCYIGAEGIRAIADALKRRDCPLEVLNLSQNKIGDEGAEAVAEILQREIIIQSLILVHCSIWESGARAIAEALNLRPRESSLKEINLCGNPIEDEGAKAFANLLKDRCMSEDLQLSYCDVSIEGTEALRDALFANHYIQVLDLDGNFHQIQKDINDGNLETELDEDYEDEETFERSEEVERRIDELMDLNKKGPLAAEVQKTFVFPRDLAGTVEVTPFPIAVEKVAQISGKDHRVSVLFSFVRECPLW